MSKLLLKNVDLRGCKNSKEVAQRFADVCDGENFDMHHEDLNFSALSSATINFSDNYISIDDINGCQCFYIEICDYVEESIELYIRIVGKPVAYYNEANDFYVIDCNFINGEDLKESEYNLDDYIVINFEGYSDKEVDELNEEISAGCYRFYCYISDNGNYLIEDEGCFNIFLSRNEMISFITPDSHQELEDAEEHVNEDDFFAEEY